MPVTPILNSFTSSVMKETAVDFNKRTITTPVELSQYDDSEDGSLVCIKINLYKDDAKYYAPDNVTVKIKQGTYGGYFAYYNALGFLVDRSTIIIPVRLQMTLIYGDYYPTVEITTTDGSTVASAPFHIHISKSPVQMDSWSNAIRGTEIFTDIQHYGELVSRINAALAELNRKANETVAIATLLTAEATDKMNQKTDETVATATKLTSDAVATATKLTSDAVAEMHSLTPLYLTALNVEEFPVTITDERITDNMACISATFSNKTAILSPLSVNTSNGSAVIDGTISGITDIHMILVKTRT